MYKYKDYLKEIVNVKHKILIKSIMMIYKMFMIII